MRTEPNCPIFVHSIFRRASIYIFNVFRRSKYKYYSFQEPLHEKNYLVSFGISSVDPIGDLVPLDRRYNSSMIHVGRQLQFWRIADAAKFDCIDSSGGNAL
jgi:hypothetical protein